jgi:DNA-binding NtrC family response regulator
MNISKYPKDPLLFVDDEQDVLDSYRLNLITSRINNVVLCNDSRMVLGLLEDRQFSAVILDLFMPHLTGQELLYSIKEQYPDLPMIVITGSNKVSTAVECMKLGALDYMVKPVEESRLITGIKNALHLRELQQENSRLGKKMLEGELLDPEPFKSIITLDAGMNAIFRYIEALSASPRPVLITGESGVGKELFAKAIHEASGRRGPFVAINAGGLEDTVFSDTLFGHRKGAFTGADTSRQGLIEKATDGTLFLDEIGTLGQASQIKLLRLLQEGDYYQLGSDIIKTSNAVIIAATNEDLQDRLKSGHFRKDLYFRLKTHSIHIPPLRHRKDDIPLLIDHFVEEAASTLGRPRPKMPLELSQILLRYDFPGNVRELQSLIFDAVSRCTVDSLDSDIIKSYVESQGQASSIVSGGDLHSGFLPPGGEFPTLREIEEFLINEAMRRTEGNMTLASQLLGIAQSTLSRRFKRKDPA